MTTPDNVPNASARGHRLRFGAVTGQHQLTWTALRDQWRAIEEFGFDSVWLFDHFMALYGDPDGPCLEASTLLAALARETSTIRIGVLVYGNTHRHPAVLAKEMVTVDHVSDGRLTLGIGSAWNEREHDAYSLPFPSAGDRVAMLDESLTVMRMLFSNRRTSFEGHFYQLHDAPFAPKPLQAHLPIMVGGKRPKMLATVARHADVWNSGGTPAELAARGAELADRCREIGRDPAEIVWSVTLGADRLEDGDGFTALVEQYRAVGVSEFLFDWPLGGTGLETATRIAREQLPRLRAREPAQSE